ncbi:c-type cytochrome [Alsobacter sp. KACC 23698]|uniref:C-type cytochrome n=1 Tax=Alsobacter sp. KACC 23698 TaxID=3149229 RepID=A0AAU7JMT0_9HYPH
MSRSRGETAMLLTGAAAGVTAAVAAVARVIAPRNRRRAADPEMEAQAQVQAEAEAGLHDPADIVEATSAAAGGRVGLLVAGLVLAAIAAAGWFWTDAAWRKREQAIALAGADPARGPELFRRYGCGGCHLLRPVPQANGRVGPPLDDVGSRVYLAGVLPNTPENLVRWIYDPRGVSPRSAMPNTGVSEAEAREIAAYLLSR